MRVADSVSTASSSDCTSYIYSSAELAESSVHTQARHQPKNFPLLFFVPSVTRSAVVPFQRAFCHYRSWSLTWRHAGQRRTRCLLPCNWMLVGGSVVVQQSRLVVICPLDCPTLTEIFLHFSDMDGSGFLEFPPLLPQFF